MNTHVQYTNKKSIFILAIPLALAAFAHLWNAVGFPAMYDDEDTYIKRAILVSEGLGPKDPDYPYDHPYFGQIFLAGVFKLIDYPASVLNPSSSTSPTHSSYTATGNNIQYPIEMLYLVPRVLMGILAVVDTFLIYKISERRYNNRNVAFIASVLFAVMPISWYTRRILLDSIQLPFLLTSVLFACHSTKHSLTVRNNEEKKRAMILLSGIFLGLAIFTKIPAITMVPLVGFLIYTNKDYKSFKTLGLWLLPVIFIPLIWPLYAASIGQFSQWVDGVNHQSHRDTDPTLTLFYSINSFFKVDPILLIMGIIGVIFATITKREILFLLWIGPYLIFLHFVGFVIPFHMISLITPLCIAAAVLIIDLPNVIGKIAVNKIGTKYGIRYFSRNILHVGISDRIKDISLRLPLAKLPFVIVFIIGIFGLISTGMLITMNLNTHHFKLYASIVQYLLGDNNAIGDYQNNVSLVSDHRYFWIPKYIFHKDYDYKDFESTELTGSKMLLLVLDESSERWLSTNILQSAFPIGGFKRNITGYSLMNNYPYTSLSENYFYHYGPPMTSEVRTNVLKLNSSAHMIHTGNGMLAKVNNRLASVVPANQSESLPQYWNDFLRNCDHIFRCIINSTTAWHNDNASLQLSTNTTNRDSWSSIYGKEIDVAPGQTYLLTTHMKLNQYATQSHISVEAYNQTSNKWHQIRQCPSGNNGPLEWKEFSCQITIPANTMKIRPVLNAGWSSQPGKQAVTLFDAIYMTKLPPINIATHTNITSSGTSNNNLIPNADFLDFSMGRIVSLCQFGAGDFDVRVSYKLVQPRVHSGTTLNLVALCSMVY